MTDEAAGRKGIAVRDWLGDAQRRIARVAASPAVGERPGGLRMGARPGRTLGVALLRRGESAAARLRLGASLSPPEERSTLRNPLTAAVRAQPRLTIQSSPPSGIGTDLAALASDDATPAAPASVAGAAAPPPPAIPPFLQTFRRLFRRTREAAVRAVAPRVPEPAAHPAEALQPPSAPAAATPVAPAAAPDGVVERSHMESPPPQDAEPASWPLPAPIEPPARRETRAAVSPAFAPREDALDLEPPAAAAPPPPVPIARPDETEPVPRRAPALPSVVRTVARRIMRRQLAGAQSDTPRSGAARPAAPPAADAPRRGRPAPLRSVAEEQPPHESPPAAGERTPSPAGKRDVSRFSLVLRLAAPLRRAAPAARPARALPTPSTEAEAGPPSVAAARTSDETPELPASDHARAAPAPQPLAGDAPPGRLDATSPPSWTRPLPLVTRAIRRLAPRRVDHRSRARGEPPSPTVRAPDAEPARSRDDAPPRALDRQPDPLLAPEGAADGPATAVDAAAPGSEEAVRRDTPSMVMRAAGSAAPALASPSLEAAAQPIARTPAAAGPAPSEDVAAPRASVQRRVTEDPATVELLEGERESPVSGLTLRQPPAARLSAGRAPAEPVRRVYRRPTAHVAVRATAGPSETATLRAAAAPAGPSVPPVLDALARRVEAASDDERAFQEARASGQPVAILRAEAGETADAEAEDEAAGAEPPDGEVDPLTVDRLARTIYPLIRRLLVVERERAGAGGRWA